MDHSKRVSATENVQAFYALVGDGVRSLVDTVDLLRQAQAQGFIRERLRVWPVLTMLTAAGLCMSLAALLFVLGVGEVQAIAVHETRSPSLYSSWWVVAGSVAAVVGLLWGLAAVAAITSQGKARREFPWLRIDVYGVGAMLVKPLVIGPGPSAPQPVPPAKPEHQGDVVYIRITSRELTRDVTLDIRLQCHCGPPYPGFFRLRAAWQEPGAQGFPETTTPQRRVPVRVDAQDTVDFFLVFAPLHRGPFITEEPLLEVVDLFSQTAVSMSPSGGTLDTGTKP